MSFFTTKTIYSNTNYRQIRILISAKIANIFLAETCKAVYLNFPFSRKYVTVKCYYVLLSHTLYQFYCPILIKYQSRDDRSFNVGSNLDSKRKNDSYFDKRTARMKIEKNQPNDLLDGC